METDINPQATELIAGLRTSAENLFASKEANGTDDMIGSEAACISEMIDSLEELHSLANMGMDDFRGYAKMSGLFALLLNDEVSKHLV